MGMGYLAFNLSDEARVELLTHFKPKFSRIVAHHVTYKFGVDETDSIPAITKLTVIGYAVSDTIECVVVEVEGISVRPDGGIFHITISHAEDAAPFDSNTLLRESGYTPVDFLILEVEPIFNTFDCVG